MCKDSGTMKMENIKKTFAEHNEIDKKMSDKSSPYFFILLHNLSLVKIL